MSGFSSVGRRIASVLRPARVGLAVALLLVAAPCARAGSAPSAVASGNAVGPRDLVLYFAGDRGAPHEIGRVPLRTAPGDAGDDDVTRPWSRPPLDTDHSAAIGVDLARATGLSRAPAGAGEWRLQAAVRQSAAGAARDGTAGSWRPSHAGMALAGRGLLGRGRIDVESVWENGGAAFDAARFAGPPLAEELAPGRRRVEIGWDVLRRVVVPRARPFSLRARLRREDGPSLLPKAWAGRTFSIDDSLWAEGASAVALVRRQPLPPGRSWKRPALAPPVRTDSARLDLTLDPARVGEPAPWNASLSGGLRRVTRASFREAGGRGSYARRDELVRFVDATLFGARWSLGGELALADPRAPQLAPVGTSSFHAEMRWLDELRLSVAATRVAIDASAFASAYASDSAMLALDWAPAARWSLWQSLNVFDSSGPGAGVESRSWALESLLTRALGATGTAIYGRSLVAGDAFAEARAGAAFDRALWTLEAGLRVLF